jgi:hypothetical protein
MPAPPRIVKLFAIFDAVHFKTIYSEPRRCGTRRKLLLRKSLLIAFALLVLPFSVLVSAGTASAEKETEKTLNARLLTDAELAAALKSNGISVAVAKTYEVPSIEDKDLLSSARRWDARDGSILFTSLLSYKDGRDLSGGDVEDVLNGEYARNFAESFFDKGTVNLVAVLDPLLDERDVTHAFEAKFEGKALEVVSISYVRGNIVGLVFFATADNQLTEAGAIFGGQTVKLPD